MLHLGQLHQSAATTYTTFPRVLMLFNGHAPGIVLDFQNFCQSKPFRL